MNNLCVTDLKNLILMLVIREKKRLKCQKLHADKIIKLCLFLQKLKKGRKKT